MAAQVLKHSVDEHLDEQRELFLWKNPDISREQVNTEWELFNKHDLKKEGRLDDHEAMMLLEHRGETKTATELRALLHEIDKDGDHHVNFLEWCCFYFEKSWDDVNNFVDEEARARALAEAKKAGEAAKIAEAEIAAAKLVEEEKAAVKAKELEEEAKLTGVKGAAAFFKRQAEGTSSIDNKAKITEEAARRKALREAKAAEEAAKAEASKVKTAEEIAEEMAAKAKAVHDEEERLEAEQLAKEKADRAARKKALNERFSHGGGQNNEHS